MTTRYESEARFLAGGKEPSDEQDKGLEKLRKKAKKALKIPKGEMAFPKKGSELYEKAKELPYAKLPPRDADGKRRMAQVDVERGQEFRKCIECFMCQDVCHVIRDHEENKAHYSGPRFFIRYAELEMHPLDTNDRRDLVREEMGLGYCNITKCCTEVCPEHIKITDNAIIPMKERVVDTKYDPVVFIGKILRRKPRETGKL